MHLGGEYPTKGDSTTSISSPCRGILFYRYWERARRQLILETEL